jgi:tetratricopeptide (TPR) repeat protein
MYCAPARRRGFDPAVRGRRPGPTTAALGPATTVRLPRACLAAARAIRDEDDHDHGTATCDVRAAELLAAAGQLDRAARLYRDALEYVDVEADPITGGRAWHNYGFVLRHLDRADESLAAQRKVLAAYRQTGLATPNAGCHVGIGLALCNIGRAGEALEPYAAARALYVEFREGEFLADVDDRRGLALCELGRYQEAAAAP